MQSDRVATPASLVGAVLGRYQLERMLGEGGMGAVYAARHQELGKLAAVKILHERYDTSEQDRIRFMREGQAISRIRHPNIVDVYDVGTEAGRIYLVMELLEGEELRRLLVREGRLPPERIADLMLSVVAAVAAAHELGVVHRDLKPDNIFLCTERGSISPKVLDFGISKVADPEVAATLTGTGALLGTPYYMSPEQARSEKDIGPSSDQYSLGVILYECVTGRLPIEEPALYQLIQRIVQGDFPAPRQLNPSIPAAFEQLILRAMARSPADRFPTTRALGRALLPFASERVRANYAEELAQDEQGVPPRPLALPMTPANGLGTTLGDSTHESEGLRPPVRPRGLGLPLAVGAVLLGVAGTLIWKFSAPTPSAPTDVAANGTPAASTERAQAASPPLPTATVEAPLTASPLPPPPTAAAPSAATKLEGSARPAKAAAAKRPVRPADRPELAPR